MGNYNAGMGGGGFPGMSPGTNGQILGVGGPWLTLNAGTVGAVLALSASNYVGVGTLFVNTTSIVAGGINVAHFGPSQNWLPSGMRFNRTAVADAAYTALVTDYIIAYSSLTLARTVTLPTGVGTGAALIIIDETGGAATKNISVIRSGSDTVNGSTAAVPAVTTNYGWAQMLYDGTSKWTLKAG